MQSQLSNATLLMHVHPGMMVIHEDPECMHAEMYGSVSIASHRSHQVMFSLVGSMTHNIQVARGHNGIPLQVGHLHAQPLMPVASSAC